MRPPAPGGPPPWLPEGLDPALPDLAAVLTPAAAARRFEGRWPGPGEPPRLRACALEHLRWSPGVECVAIYRLTASGSAIPTIGVVTVRPDAVHHRLFTADHALPGLASATDPMVMRGWLAARLGRPVEECTITPVSYRPGSRCMLRYELPGGDGAVVYGKVLARDGFEALAAAASALDGGLVPPLVGVAPRWRLVAQADAGGPSLRSVAVDPLPDGAIPELRAAGRLLARLHARSSPPGPRRSLAEDARALRPHLRVIEQVSPATAAGFAEGVERLEALAGPEAATAPGHGAFRLDQVHLAAGGPVFIDLDSYCWAEPARDLGNLLAYLRWREIREPGATAALALVRNALLEGYAGESGAAPDAARVALHEAAASLKIAGRCHQKLAVRQWERVGLLVGSALERLGAGAGRGS